MKELEKTPLIQSWVMFNPVSRKHPTFIHKQYKMSIRTRNLSRKAIRLCQKSFIRFVEKHCKQLAQLKVASVSLF